MEISIYISLAQSIRKPWKLSLGTATPKLFVSHTGLYKLLRNLMTWKSIALILLVIYNVIKSSYSGSICWYDLVEIKLKLFLNSAIKFYIGLLICQSFYLYYASNRGQNEWYKNDLLNFVYFVNVFAILLQNFPFHQT